MSKVRRTAYAFLYLEDDYLLDVRALLGGEAPTPAPQARILALAVLTGESHRLNREQLEVLLSVPAERWIEPEDRDPGVVRELALRGLLVSDADDRQLTALRKRDESLSANEWNVYAALYHYMTKWSAVDFLDGGDQTHFIVESQQAARAFVAEYGQPPAPFADVRSLNQLSMPGADREGSLYQTLTARRTTRAFDQDVPMKLQELDTVLRYVFGCHGYARTVADIVCIKRTSPSGGGLHPIEAYPIIRNVTGVAPGIYHYNAREHALSLVSELTPAECDGIATSFTCGQSYFGAAHVTFVLTARFYRNYWKYRRHPKAYAAILMDAAHLSQTLYLVSGELGIGAFVTIAINAKDIEERLELDGVSEGVIAVAGCGRRAPGESPLELRFSPHP